MAFYSSGAKGAEMLTPRKATELMRRARDPDAGKPLPGKKTRLYQGDRGGHYIEYHDTRIIDIHPDGSYTLDHGGYPTRMTAQKISEWTPANVCAHSTRVPDGWGGYDIDYENLELLFGIDVPGQLSIFQSFIPSDRHGSLTFINNKMRIDSKGMPVLDWVLRQIAPPSWRHPPMADRVQAWAVEYELDWGTGYPVPFVSLATDPKSARLPIFVRRAWNGNQALAIIIPRQAGQVGGPVWEWAVRIPRGPWVKGTDANLEIAFEAADVVLRDSDWSLAPPTLREAIGGTPTGSLRARLDRVVLRAHWYEPWDSWGGDISVGRRNLDKHPIPGSMPWPGEEIPIVWFELQGAIGVAVVEEEQTGLHRLVVRNLKARERTRWDTDSWMAAGLVTAVLGILGSL